jgi:hypothetical protein
LAYYKFIYNVPAAPLTLGWTLPIPCESFNQSFDTEPADISVLGPSLEALVERLDNVIRVESATGFVERWNLPFRGIAA